MNFDLSTGTLKEVQRKKAGTEVGVRERGQAYYIMGLKKKKNARRRPAGGGKHGRRRGVIC